MLLAEYGIHTTQDLTELIERFEHKIRDLERERQLNRNLLRRPKPPAVENEIRWQITQLTMELKPIRRQLRMAKGIQEKLPTLYRYLIAERDMEERARARNRERGR